MLWIRVIGSHLAVNGDCPQDDDWQVGERAEDWIPDVEDEHRGFYEQYEHGEHRDRDVEVC